MTSPIPTHTALEEREMIARYLIGKAEALQESPLVAFTVSLLATQIQGGAHLTQGAEK